MTDEQLAPIIQSCLEQIAAGASVETCLAAYPSQREQLEPLLRAAVRVVNLPRPALEANARAAIEQRVLAQVALQRMPATQPDSPAAPIAVAPRWFGLPRSLLLLIALGVLLLIALLLPLLAPRPQPLIPGATVILPVPSQPLAATAMLSPVPTIEQRPTGTAVVVTTAETLTQRRPDPTVPAQIVPIAPPAQPPAAPAEPGQGTTDNQDSGKNCQGLQIGRDDKKCTPDKPNDKGDDKGNNKPGK